MSHVAGGCAAGVGVHRVIQILMHKRFLAKTFSKVVFSIDIVKSIVKMS